jgi:hypothetical protein
MARAFCLSVRGFTRLSIGQPFAFDTFERALGAFDILDAKARAIVVAEIEFGEIAMQMLLADVVECTNYAALENRKIVFSGIDVNEAA